VHVSDVARLIELAHGNEQRGFEILNVGSCDPTSPLQVAELLRLLGSGSTLTVTGDFRAGDTRNCFADLTKARERLRFQPAVSIGDGLARFVRWVMTQEVVEDRSALAQRELSRLGLGRAV